MPNEEKMVIIDGCDKIGSNNADESETAKIATTWPRWGGGVINCKETPLLFRRPVVVAEKRRSSVVVAMLQTWLWNYSGRGNTTRGGGGRWSFQYSVSRAKARKMGAQDEIETNGVLLCSRGGISTPR